MPQKKLCNVRGYEIIDTRKEELNEIYVTARIRSSTASGTSLNGPWEFQMFRDSTRGEWKIENIRMVGG